MIQHPMHRRLTAICLAAGMSLLSLQGCKKKADDAPDVSVTVQTAHPTQGPISEEIVADAILAPLSQAAIAPRISSAIRVEYVQRGAHVRKGQLLVSLEDRDLQGAALDTAGAVSSAQANYTATTKATIPEEVKKAELDAKQLKVALDIANRTAEERDKLYRQGALSGRDADAAHAAAVQASVAYDTARQHAEAVTHTTQITDQQAAQGQLASAKGRLQNAEAQVSYANLRSPIDGVVTDRPLFPGETAAAGVAVITIMDTSSLFAKLHLAQASAQKLTLGHKAEVAVPGLTDPVEATVSFISPALDAGSTTVEVWLKLPNAHGTLKVGTPVHATITGQTIQNAMQIPSAALLPATDEGASVMVVGQDGLAHKRTVKIGIRTDESAQITSGLTIADEVITSGAYGLDDKTKVMIARKGAGGDDFDQGAGGKAGDKE